MRDQRMLDEGIEKSESQKPESITLTLGEITNEHLRQLCGPEQQNIQRLESALDICFYGHAGNWRIEGEQGNAAAKILRFLLEEIKQGNVDQQSLENQLRLHRAMSHETDGSDRKTIPRVCLQAGRRRVEGKTPNQRRYLYAMQQSILTVAIGPAGSGKTYLAVAAAVAALNSGRVERIILTRPAVEAGERLGFLPGDLQKKVDPYLIPLFDALSDMLGADKMLALMEQKRIEIAPLAYMRGRTLNDAFVILDEAQNTTRSQMKMFLTRLGFSSRMVVTGDVTQIDLPHDHMSGLLHAMNVLINIKDVHISHLQAHDVIRHHLVEQIVRAYEKHGEKE